MIYIYIYGEVITKNNTYPPKPNFGINSEIIFTRVNRCRRGNHQLTFMLSIVTFTPQFYNK